MPEKPVKKKRIWAVAAIALAAFLAFWLYPRPLTATSYEVRAEVTAPLRIVQLADLHSKRFGQDNAKLIALVSEQEPDLIFMTGDMIKKDEAGLSGICDLVSALSGIAPVYYSFGNSETARMSASDEDLPKALTDAGARVLELRYDDVEVNGQALRIGGYSGYYRTPQMETGDERLMAEKLAFADDFENTARQKLLLAHVATSWTDWERIDDHPVGVVFCGHYHGGQIRLPVIDRGLYAPYVGWFPEYTKGVFEGDCAVCVLSAGLGSDGPIPRIYDPPEIVTVDLVPNV